MLQCTKRGKQVRNSNAIYYESSVEGWNERLMLQLRLTRCPYRSWDTGAAFDLWESKKASGIEVDSRAHGSPGWFELLTKDTATAAAFYEALFGWQSQQLQSPSGSSEYTKFTHAGRDVAGMRSAPQLADERVYWSTAVTVKDADAAASTAVSLGGTVHTPVQELLKDVRCCSLVSPQGVHFSAIQYAA
jgi:uncharacterized protein